MNRQAKINYISFADFPGYDILMSTMLIFYVRIHKQENIY